MPTILLKDVPQELYDALQAAVGMWKPRGGGKPTTRGYLIETVRQRVKRDLRRYGILNPKERGGQ